MKTKIKVLRDTPDKANFLRRKAEQLITEYEKEGKTIVDRMELISEDGAHFFIAFLYKDPDLSSHG